MSNLKITNNQVDLCYKNACVKTKGPAADYIAGIVLITTIVVCAVYIGKLVR